MAKATTQSSLLHRLEPAPGTPKEPTASDDRRDSARTVLIVEDIQLNLRLLGLMVQALGYLLETALSGEDAIEAVRDSRFGLILMDCLMPQMDGRDAARIIRQMEEGTGHRTPIVAVTADAMPGSREACLAAGMDHYISKPVLLEDLQVLFARWLPPQPEPKAVIDPDVFTLAMPVYLRELSGRLDAIRRAVGDQDPEALRLAAHILRSTSALVGAATLAELCERLETAAVAGARDGLPDIVADIESETAKARTSVEAALAANGPSVSRPHPETHSPDRPDVRGIVAAELLAQVADVDIDDV
jgi:CheY-like chemotaxis protein